MTFNTSHQCWGYNKNADPQVRPAMWFSEARNKVQELLRNGVNEYKSTLCSEAVYEKALSRYDYANMRFCENVVVKTENGKSVLVERCITIPGISDKEVSTANLGEKGEYLAKVYLTIESLAWDFDNGSECEKKKIFSLMFADDEQKFADLCKEVIG